MASIISDNDFSWEEPDNRIYTLRHHVIQNKTDITLLVPSVESNTNKITRLELITALNYLFNLGKLTQEELNNIHQMLSSIDQENHYLAFESIKQKLFEIDRKSVV